MPYVQLITDGTALLPAERLRELNIISLPIVAQVGTQQYMYDQKTFEHYALLDAIRGTRAPVEIVGPSADDFRAVFQRTLYRTNQMLVILSSGHLSPVARNARLAARDFMGRCDIHILDSQTISVGLGLLVERAGELLQQGNLPLAEVVRQVRGMISRIYAVMITHTTDYLYRSGKLSAMQAILGAMLNIHPFVVIEDGEIIPQEKSRSAEKAVDRLVEFASEFSRVQTMTIFQSGPESKPVEEALNLRSQLELAMPGREFPIITYDPILAARLGPDALGLIVFEGGR